MWILVDSVTSLKLSDPHISRLPNFEGEKLRIIFTMRRNCASMVLGVVILSVRPIVSLSHACFVTKSNNALRIFWYHRKGQSLYFSDTNRGWWPTPPSIWNLCGACVMQSLCHSWAICSTYENIREVVVIVVLVIFLVLMMWTTNDLHFVPREKASTEPGQISS